MGDLALELIRIAIIILLLIVLFVLIMWLFGAVGWRELRRVLPTYVGILKMILPSLI